MTDEELYRRFMYHPPEPGDVVKYEIIRSYARCMAKNIVALCPEGREQSLAITKLEEAVFWANAAIARKE